MAIPSTPDLRADGDTGVSDTDNITKIQALPLVGTADPLTLVKIYDTDGTTVVGSAMSLADGSYTVVTTNLSEGVHTLTATETDGFGNEAATPPVFPSQSTLRGLSSRTSPSRMTTSSRRKKFTRAFP